MAIILLATGDTTAYDIFSAEISGEGHELVWAIDGQEAYDLALENMPDLALLDLSLPIFNAFETCELLRNDPDFPPHLPVFILTDEDLSAKQLEGARATGAFPKTHLAQELRDVLVDHLGPKAGG